MKKIFSIIVLLTLSFNIIVPTVLASNISSNEIQVKQNINNETNNKTNNANVTTNQSNNTNTNNDTVKDEDNIDENKTYDITKNENVNETNSSTRNIMQNNSNKENTTKAEEPEPVIIDEPKSINNTNTTLQGEEILGNGKIYTIKSNVGGNQYLDISGGSQKNSANVQIWNKLNGNQQKFKLIYNREDKTYTIMAVHSDKVLDVAGASRTNGTNVQQYESNKTNAQKWIIKDTGKDTGGKKNYTIVSKLSTNEKEKVLDVACGSNANGTNVQIFESNGSSAQTFQFEEVKPIEGTKALGDGGTYKIYPTSGGCLDIAGASQADGANLHVWGSDNFENQKFEFKYNEQDKTYTIKTKHTTNKVLDVAGAGKANGTNVQQYASNDSDAQRWIVKDTGDGEHFNIISKCNELSLDVAGGSSANGTNIQVYESNGSNAQKFLLKKVEKIEPKKVDLNEQKSYKISSAVNSNFVLSVQQPNTKNGENININKKQNVKQQVFTIKRNKDNTYTIEIPYSIKVLDVAGGGKTNGSNVQQYESNNSDAQKWILKKVENEDYYYIISKNSNLYLDVAGGIAQSGSNIQTYEGNGSNAQKFKFEELTEELTPDVYDGTYRISTELSNQKEMALDIDGGKQVAGSNLQIWSSTNVLQQKFQITHIKNGYYTIEPTHCSNMALEVQNNGRNVWQNTKNVNSDAQLWMIEKIGNNTYYIRSKLNGLYLDVNAANATDGNNVQLWEGNNTDAQKWKIQEVYFGIDISHYQGNVDFDALKNSRRAEYMIIKAGEYWVHQGKECFDEKFEEYYREAKRVGMPLGTYWYTYANCVADVKPEMDKFLQALNRNGIRKEFELPVFVDVESSNQVNLSQGELTNICIEYCKQIRAAGYRPGIYINATWLQDKKIDLDRIDQDVAIWVARYGYNDGYVPGKKFEYTGKRDIWQYSSRGRIDGINNDVDVNIAYKKMW